MPLACICTRTCVGPGSGRGTSLICHALLTAGTTAAFITHDLLLVRFDANVLTIGARGFAPRIASLNPGSVSADEPVGGRANTIQPRRTSERFGSNPGISPRCDYTSG